MKLFTYCIPVDNGAAPNPYWGVCTLNICKPQIRNNSQVGDWIVGLGSKDVLGMDYSRKVVYAMKVTDKMTMAEYDQYCKNWLPGKIPDIRNNDYRRKVGDCIYDFDSDPDGKLRPSVHGLKNRSHDLNGKYTLLSDHFYYFGKNAISLPSYLNGIIKQGPGHQSIANEPFKEPFINWIENLGYEINLIHGNPQIRREFGLSKSGKGGCDN
jgi:hypothetical protein